MAVTEIGSLGSLETRIMQVAWDHPGEFLPVRTVLGFLDGDLAYTTVMTVMNRLFEKGLLRRRRSGRAWSYRAALSRDAFAAASMAEALRVAKDRRGALLHFVADLNKDEADALRRLFARDES